jgi:hypothetical protein
MAYPLPYKEYIMNRPCHNVRDFMQRSVRAVTHLMKDCGDLVIWTGQIALAILAIASLIYIVTRGWSGGTLGVSLPFGITIP